MKRGIYLIFPILLLALVSNASALSYTWKTGASGSWFTATNWVAGIVPTNADDVKMYGSSSVATGAVIESGNAVTVELRLGGPAGTGAGTAYITMNSGTLSTNNWLMIGPDSASGTPPGRNGAFIMNGGTVTLGVVAPTSGHLFVGHGHATTATGLTGTLTMDGGTITANGDFCIGRYPNANGYVYLSGGTIYANNFKMREGGGTGTVYMDITGSGKVIVNDNRTAAVATFIASGWLTGNGNDYDIMYDYDITNPGKTTVWAIPEPATVCLLGFGLLGLFGRKK